VLFDYFISLVKHPIEDIERDLKIFKQMLNLQPDTQMLFNVILSTSTQLEQLREVFKIILESNLTILPDPLTIVMKKLDHGNPDICDWPTEAIDTVLNSSRILTVTTDAYADAMHIAADTGTYLWRAFNSLYYNDISRDITKQQWKYMLTDAITGGDVNIVKTVLDDPLTDLQSEIEDYNDLFYLAMKSPFNPKNDTRIDLLKLLLSDKRIDSRNIMTSAFLLDKGKFQEDVLLLLLKDPNVDIPTDNEALAIYEQYPEVIRQVDQIVSKK